MSKSTRRGFVTGTMAAGAAAFSAAPNALAGNSNAAFQGRPKEKWMKFAVEVGNIGNNTVEETIQYAKDLGIEAISMTWERVPGFQEKGYFDGASLKAVRSQIEAAGFVFTAMQGSVGRGMATPGADADKQLDALRRNLDAMAEAKADLLMGFVSVPRTGPWDQVVSVYSKLMKEFEPRGVRLASHSGGAISSYASMAQLMKEVPSASNGICFCTGNVWHAEHEKIYDIPAELLAKFFYVHIRNVKTGLGEKEFYFDDGDIDFPKMIGALRKAGYHGYMRSEHLPTDKYNRPRASDIGTAWAQGYMRALQQLT